MILNETIKKGKHHPIFVILTEGKTPLVSNGISFFTHSKFTHCSISFDPTMQKIYSFNFRNGHDGFIEENLFMLNNSHNISIFVFFVDSETKNKIKKNFNKFKNNKELTKFSFSRLFLKIINRGSERNPYHQVCSSFVYTVLHNAGVDIAPDNIKLVSPADIDKTISINNTIYPLYYGSAIDFDAISFADKLEKLYKDDKINPYKNLNESISPDMVDRSNYINFNLFGLFNIFTTNKDLQFNEIFIKNMRWVKDRLEEIAEDANFKLLPYELTLCNSFEDLDEFYDHKAPKWVTGFTWENKVFMKAPNIYKGDLYYNIVLHEAIHVMFWNNLKIKGKHIKLRDEEGFALFFSTPIDKWLKELNHGANWYYYESAIDIQEDYINGGMDLVLKKRVY